MNYLRIVNPTVCPIEGFTVLGVSTSRGKDELIGQFGSGNKHAVNVCLRNGLNPIIYCGTKRLEFFTKPEVMGDKNFNRVYCKVSNRKPERLSIAAEYGEQDWGSIGMALREFVSNAIDAAGGTISGVKVDIVTEAQLTPRRDKTIVAIPLTPEVQKWYSQLPHMFLHFGHRKNFREQRILTKKQPDACYVYRKGVMVRILSESKDGPSLFDYNFGDELEIDESRNMSDVRVREKIAEVVAESKTALVGVFQAMRSNTKCVELALPEWELKWTAKNNQAAWKAAWKEVNGDAHVALGFTPLVEMARNKGYRVQIVENSSYYAAMRDAGIPCVLDCLDNVNGKGHIMLDPEERDLKVMDQVWDWLEAVDLTKGKDKPKLTLFEVPMDGESSTRGYYLAGVIYIHVEDRANPQTYMEELAHYVTGSSDYSRDFQDYAFRVATKLGLLLDS